MKTVYILLALACVLLCVGVSTASPTISMHNYATIDAAPTPEVSTFCRDVTLPSAMNDYALISSDLDPSFVYATSPARPIHYPIAQIATNASTSWKVNVQAWNGFGEGKPLTVL